MAVVRADSNRDHGGRLTARRLVSLQGVQLFGGKGSGGLCTTTEKGGASACLRQWKNMYHFELTTVERASYATTFERALGC